MGEPYLGIQVCPYKVRPNPTGTASYTCATSVCNPTSHYRKVQDMSLKESENLLT